jgi:hypothetical protein
VLHIPDIVILRQPVINRLRLEGHISLAVPAGPLPTFSLHDIGGALAALSLNRSLMPNDGTDRRSEHQVATYPSKPINLTRQGAAGTIH